ncbi:phosphomevalonate kinase [Nocardia tengchongensis]|uniref:phosphomevalonate kinase n=1 Tax=Nocardia tengchongensis TaxID=2055889 RepID=UPI0036CBE6D6
MIECRAPGKLYLAGEYAVLSPGRPARIMAVDRFARVRVTDAAATTVHTDLCAGHEHSIARDGDRVRLRHHDRPADQLASVAAAIAIVERLVRERNLPPRTGRVEITTDLHGTGGRKLGLGSSAAVTVAVIDALARHHELRLPPAHRYRLAMLASMTADPHCSGGDLAAATFGGIVRYQRPDPRALRMPPGWTVDDALHRPWSGLSITPVEIPPGLRIEVGWTGSPARSAERVAVLYSRGGTEDPRYGRFLARSDAAVDRITVALADGDIAAVAAEIRLVAASLATLDREMGLGIMTPALSELCRIAEAAGAAAKPSGAGGGDCGIAVLDAADLDAARAITTGWRRAGIDPLSLALVPSTALASSTAVCATQKGTPA